MKIALASDHAGFELKKGVAAHLAKMNFLYKDFGCHSSESVDYVDFAEKAATAILRGEFDRGILVCGTGLGMAMTANKFKGIRATPVLDEYMAEMSRKHNDSNCLTLGGRILPLDEALRVVDVWLETLFEGGRHQSRLDKITAIEERNFRS